MMSIAAFSAAAAVAVVASAFAVYALLEPHLGRAGAAGALAGGLVLIMVFMAMFLALTGRKSSKAQAVPTGLVERGIAFIRQKPIMAASAAIGAGAMAVRNPKYLGEVLRAFIDGKSRS